MLRPPLIVSVNDPAIPSLNVMSIDFDTTAKATVERTTQLILAGDLPMRSVHNVGHQYP
jgi:hypothetical protein